KEKSRCRKLSGDVLLAQCLRDVHQMIVVHPDEIVGLRTAGDGLCVTFVNLFVSWPVCWLEVAEILQIVKKRPDHLVGITVVKFVPFGFTQSYRHNLVTGIARGLGQRFLWDFARDSRPAYPGSASFTQHRLDCGHEPSCSWCDSP